MHQEEFVYDEIASPREIMLASRNVSYDDQNCRPSYGYSYDNIGNRKTAQEPVGELAYSPYGQAASTGDLVQPVQWSAEMHDDDLAQVYYNYRYYNPKDGRWINRVQSLQKEDGICMGLLIMEWYSLLIISEKKLTNLATQ